MYNSFAAPQAKGKAANDIIFAANALAVADAAAIGAENVTNGTIGAILDDDSKLVCLPTVETVFRNLPINEVIAYAPIAGTADYLEKVQRALDDENATYGDFQRVEAQVEVQLGADSEYFTSLYDSYSYNYADIDKEENTQLSYRTAAFFVQYLIDKYSLNSFFQYSIDNVSFEEAFGTSFSEALKTWQEEFLQDVD